MLGDPSSERSQARRHHERRTASDGNGIVEAFPQKFAPTSPRVAAESIGRSQGAESPESWNAPADRQSPALWAARELSSTSLARLDSRVSVESLDRSQLRRSRQVSGGISTPISSAREEALRLAISSVPITSPNVGQSSGPATPGGPTRSASYASLMSDEPSAGKHVSGKGKDKESASSSTGSSGGKGVLFFAIHEAAIDAKGAGTWYLALATSKTVLLYEAVPPKGDSARSWTFIKELYAPFAPKAMSFLAASTTTDLGSAGLGSASASTKLSVGSTDAPLTATSAKHGKRTASPPMTNLGYSSILKPQHGRGTAGPTAWARADLSLLLSFGRRAVIIRLSDSNVRELDLMPMPPPGTPSGSLGRTAGAGLSFTDAEPFAATHRSASSSSHSHHRSSSLDYSKDLNASTKQNWVGVHPVEARIILRQKAVRAPVRGDTSTSSSTPMSGPTPAAWSSAAQTDTRPGLHPTESGRPSSSLINSRQHSREKDLPRAPAPQGLSFPARPFGEDGRIVMDDSSSSELSDDEHLGFPVQDVSRALALSDTELVAVSASGLGTATSPARRGISSGTSSPTGQVLTANVVLLSRGKTTQVLPLPLPADLAHPRPLGVLHWSDAPTAVTAFGRIVGVERASSTGAMTTTSLGAAASRSRDGHHHAGFQPQSIVLRMSLTALAFLSSRVEMKRTTLRVEVPLSTAFASDAELELRPCHSPDADPDSGPVVDPIARPSLANPTVSTEAELEYRCGMLLATPANGGAPANTTGPVSFSPPGAAGDAGAFAFDWRGGNDYRVFYVGAEV